MPKDISFWEDAVVNRKYGFLFNDEEDAKETFLFAKEVFEDVLIDMILTSEKKVDCSWG